MAGVELKDHRHIREVLSSMLFINATFMIPAMAFQLILTLPGIFKEGHHRKEQGSKFFTFGLKIVVQRDVFLVKLT